MVSSIPRERHRSRPTAFTDHKQGLAQAGPRLRRPHVSPEEGGELVARVGLAERESPR